jgi:UPF0716 protein FxsA
MPLFVIFIVIPLIEIVLFIQIGGEIGILTTLLLTFITALIGSFLVRSQGLRTLLSARGALEKGGMPLQQIFDGICIAVAGALLITPGFLTDFIGFALLVPRLRHLLQAKTAHHFKGGFTYSSGQARRSGQNNARRPHDEDDIIEGEYEKVDEDQTRLK